MPQRQPFTALCQTLTRQRPAGRADLHVHTTHSDGTYTRVYQGTWYAHFYTGYFNVGVDAVTRGTLYDDTLPYSASWWGVPYRVY